MNSSGVTTAQASAPADPCPFLPGVFLFAGAATAASSSASASGGSKAVSAAGAAERDRLLDLGGDMGASTAHTMSGFSAQTRIMMFLPAFRTDRQTEHGCFCHPATRRSMRHLRCA